MLAATSFRLPCGAEVPNRLCKAATTECLADPRTNDPNARHAELYRQWAAGGVGLLITGNVMVDRRYMEAPRNVVMDRLSDRAAWQRFAAACHPPENPRCVALVQLSHAGRQCPLSVAWQSVAPSAVPFRLPGVNMQITRTPRALESAEIDDIVERFAWAAQAVVEAGFDGVQVHSAHGYLLSQFLSPLVNRREDEWGGDIAARMRLLLAVVRRVREAIGPEKVLSVKLNSADFQKGGFTEQDSEAVLAALSQSGLVDLVEVSGGTYENAVMCSNTGALRDGGAGEQVKASTRAREGFFLNFAQRVRRSIDLPLMVTGGFRSRDGIEAALASKDTDIVGIARPLCLDAALPRKLLAGEIDKFPDYQLTVGVLDQVLAPGLNNLWHQRQIDLLSRGQTTNAGLGFAFCLSWQFARTYFLDPVRRPLLALGVAVLLLAGPVALLARLLLS